MEKEIKTATLIDEEGNEFELEVLKEFNYKDKNYAVLYEDGCDCDEDCECHHEEECDCDEDCECHHEEEEESDEDYDCECAHDNGHIYILEVVKDEDGNDKYNEVDENLMEELIPVVEKELYLTEE
jgi:hypothetical protein